MTDGRSRLDAAVRARAGGDRERPLRVLTVIDSLVPGGAERSLEALAPATIARGIRMDVATLWDRPGIQEHLRDAGCRIFDVSGGGGRLGWRRRLRELIRRTSPDLVHTTLFEADIAGRTAARAEGVPVVTSLVSELYGPEHLAVPGYRRWKVRACQVADAATGRLAVRFHANARHVAETMSRRLRIPRDRIDVIPRGRDERALGVRTAPRRAAARAALGLAPDRTMVLAAARHEHPKGLDVLVEAFARVPGDAILVIAGREGAATPALERALAGSGLGERARLLGHRDDVADLLCAADVFVLPSRREGFPGVLPEAMALGCPIVAAGVPGAVEALGPDDADDAVGILVPTGDARALTDAIARALADTELRASLARAGVARFHARYTIDRVAEQMVAFYRRALAARA